MTGRKVPWTKSWAIAYFYNNPAFGKQRHYLKRQAVKEDRRYLKEDLKKELDILTPEIEKLEGNTVELFS